jgi:hypothetical protein
LNDPRRFKAPYNPKERIWQEADRLRAEHPAGRELRTVRAPFAVAESVVCMAKQNADGFSV